MPSFASAITDLFRSIYETIGAAVGLVFGLVRGAFATVAHFVEAVFHLFSDVLRSAVSFTGGVGKFIASNFVLLAVVAAAGFVYVQWQQQQQQRTGQKTTPRVQVNGSSKGTRKTDL